MPLKKISKIIVFAVLSEFLLMPMALAYVNFYGSPLDYFENEWVLFTVLFLLFFAVVFYTINKTFKNNVVSGVIGLGISLLLTMAITRKGFLWGYGNGLDAWVLLIAILIGLAFLIRFATTSFGMWGTICTVILVWVLIAYIDPYQFLPDPLLESPEFMSFYEGILRTFVGAVILIVLAFFLGSISKKNDDPVKRFFKRMMGP